MNMYVCGFLMSLCVWVSVRRALPGGVFVCPACRIRGMDPFNKMLEERRGMLKLVIVQPPVVPVEGVHLFTMAFLKLVLCLRKLRRRDFLGGPGGQ